MIKNTEVWKIGIMIVLCLIILIWSGYTISTKWGSVYKDDADKMINKKITKIKAQTNYSLDMKTYMLMDLSTLYEEKLKIYCKRNNIAVNPEMIASDVQYYQLITIAMNDVCENITIDRYVHNNDLYRYRNKNDWDVFKANVINLYIKEGKQILTTYYDNDKVIMPVYVWMDLAEKDLYNIVEKNTDKLLEDLKTESLIYYNSLENGSK
jgi:hypothetical protein